MARKVLPPLPRDAHGVPHVDCADEREMYAALGRCHATDRGMQMLLTRLLGRGQASEFLRATDETLAIDTFFRRMNWHGGGANSGAAGGSGTDAGGLSPRARDLCDAYCAGVNAVFAARVPWEFRLFGYRPDPWTLADSLLLARMSGYISLAQSQGEVERLLIEMVQGGVRRELLDELFPGLLADLDEPLLRGVRLGHRVVPEAVRWSNAVPRMMASNNWVVAGSRTASGKPMLANDPHLEANRLPNVWYEIVLRTPGRYLLGATMPGLPAVILGRTPDLAWGATYSMMDAVDSWIERCRDGKCLRETTDGERWEPLRPRKEIIRRKGKPPVELTFYENEHGVLDGDPFTPGDYLATRWSGAGMGAASISHFCEMFDAPNVAAGMDRLGRVESAWNWVLADRGGNIGYQMSGLMPRRRAGVRGFVPLPGWRAENDWDGFVPPEELPRCLNPAEGFFVTANEDLNKFGKTLPINRPMGNERGSRIRQMLRDAGATLNVGDAFRMQLDVYGPQAEAYMDVMRPLLPDTAAGRVLRDWDCQYTLDSRGAFLFEIAYRALVSEVFGRNGLGADVADYLHAETGMLSGLYPNLDRVLLSETSAWFGGETREAIYRRVLTTALENVEPRPWGETHTITLTNILFGGRLPRALGFDRGPIPVPGGRATVRQGQIFRSGGRTTSFIPSFRLVTDLAADEVHTNMSGGPSDRRFSRWYASDVKNWINGTYKRLRGFGAR